jgi:hypothetical protein
VDSEGDDGKAGTQSASLTEELYYHDWDGAPMSLESDRDRRHTAAAVLQRIDDETEARLHAFAEARPDVIAARLGELDREWDVDRAVELESSLMGMMGLALGAFVRPAFLAAPAIVGAAVFLHATVGWYPLLPLFRRMGLRTSREIARERYALKALRGDFHCMETRRRAPTAAASASPAGVS